MLVIDDEDDDDEKLYWVHQESDWMYDVVCVQLYDNEVQEGQEVECVIEIIEVIAIYEVMSLIDEWEVIQRVGVHLERD